MLRILYKFGKNVLHSYFRKGYWIFRLSKATVGKKAKFVYPVLCEGGGYIKLGNENTLDKRVSIQVNKLSRLTIGDKGYLERESNIRINRNSSLNIGDDFHLGQFSRVYIHNDWKFGNQVKIGTNCSIFAREQDLMGKLNIANGTHIGDFSIIDVCDNVTIGNEVAIGPNCTLYTHDHDYKNHNLAAWKGAIISSPIEIDDGAWIGSGVTILPGIKIGRGAVIAAGSIVTKDVDPKTLVGGIPAKVIKTI